MKIKSYKYHTIARAHNPDGAPRFFEWEGEFSDRSIVLKRQRLQVQGLQLRGRGEQESVAEGFTIRSEFELRFGKLGI
jgi:hypothetical protein